ARPATQAANSRGPSLHQRPRLPRHRPGDGDQRGGGAAQCSRSPEATQRGTSTMTRKTTTRTTTRNNGSITDIEQRLRRGGDRDLSGELEVATDGFRRRAEKDRLVDVAYTTIDSPFGPLLAAATPRGLVTLSFGNMGFDRVLVDLAVRV